MTGSELAVSHDLHVDSITTQTRGSILDDTGEVQTLTQAEQIFLTMINEMLPKIQADAPTNHLQIRWLGVDTTISPGDSTALEVELLRYAHFCRGLGADHFKWGVDGTKFFLSAHGSSCELPEVEIQPLIELSLFRQQEAEIKNLKDQLQRLMDDMSVARAIEQFHTQNIDIEEVSIESQDGVVLMTLAEFYAVIQREFEHSNTLSLYYDRATKHIFVFHDGQMTTYGAMTKDDKEHDQEQSEIRKLIENPLTHIEACVADSIRKNATTLSEALIGDKKKAILPLLLQLNLAMLQASSADEKEAAQIKLETLSSADENMSLSYEEKLQTALRATVMLRESMEKDARLILPPPTGMSFSAAQEEEYLDTLIAQSNAIETCVRKASEKAVQTLFSAEAQRIISAKATDAELHRLLALIPEELHTFSRRATTHAGFFAPTESVSIMTILQSFSPQLHELFLDEDEQFVNVSEHRRRQNVAQKYFSLMRREQIIKKVEQSIEIDFLNIRKLIQDSSFYFPASTSQIIENCSILEIVRNPESADAEVVKQALEEMIKHPILSLNEKRIIQISEFLSRLGVKIENNRKKSQLKPEYGQMLRRVERTDHTIDLEFAADLVPEVILSEMATEGVIVQTYLSGLLTDEQIKHFLGTEEKKRARVVEYTRERLAAFKNVVNSLTEKFVEHLQREHAPRKYVEQMSENLSYGLVLLTGENMLERYTSDTGSVKQAYLLATQAWATVYKDSTPDLGWKP